MHILNIFQFYTRLGIVYLHNAFFFVLFFCLQRYLDEAEREKVQYARELREYQKSEAYQITSAKIQDKRIKKGQNTSLMLNTQFAE